MASLGDVVNQVRRLLGDPGGDAPLYPDELISDGVLEALKTILPWVAKESAAAYTGDGSTFEYALPSDCAEVDAVWSGAQGAFLPRAGFFPGAAWSYGEGSALDENAWLDYPAGRLILAAPPANGKVIQVFYSAYWPEPADLTDTLAAPEYALPGIKYYAAAYALAPKAVSSANVRQFNTKVDSGTPVQNPMADMVKFFLARFEAEMGRCPMRPKGQKTR
jgi:hypothetical protein